MWDADQKSAVCEIFPGTSPKYLLQLKSVGWFLKLGRLSKDGATLFPCDWAETPAGWVLKAECRKRRLLPWKVVAGTQRRHCHLPPLTGRPVRSSPELKRLGSVDLTLQSFLLTFLLKVLPLVFSRFNSPRSWWDMSHIWSVVPWSRLALACKSGLLNLQGFRWLSLDISSSQIKLDALGLYNGVCCGSGGICTVKIGKEEALSRWESHVLNTPADSTA